MHHGICVIKTGWNNQGEDAQYHRGWLPCICNIYEYFARALARLAIIKLR